MEMTRLQPSIGTAGSIQIWICFAAGACCFTPLMLHPSNNQGISVLKQALTSHQNRDSAVAALALTAPIFIEITTELTVAFLRRNDATKGDIHLEQEVLNWSERLILLCGIMTIPIAAFLPSETANLVDIFICLRKCRAMLVSGAIIISLCRYDPKFWSVRVTYLILLLLATGTITSAFAAFFDIAANVGIVLFFSGVAVFFVCNARWINSVRPKLAKVMPLSNAIKEISRKEEGTAGITDILCLLFYILSFTLISLVLVAVQLSFQGIDLYSPNALLCNNLTFLLYLLLILHISKRKTKFKVVQGLRSLIEAKKMYVRYISHELRTPLNAAFLGLTLVSDDLMSSINDKDSDHCETLLCVKSACRTAVEILNDLLCFDKLESGILEMHKHDVPVIPFIADCVNMFTPQARAAGITIKNITSQVRLLPEVVWNMSDYSSMPMPPPPVTDLLQGDIVSMDKFKMDQVLRNLISNSLKFTPRGGSVTVCASFIPNQMRVDDCSLLPAPTAAVSGSWTSLSGLLSCLTDPTYHCKWLTCRRSRVHVNETGIAEDLEVGLDNLSDASPHYNGVRGTRFKHTPSALKPKGVSGDGCDRHGGPGLSDISNSSVPSDADDASQSLSDCTDTIAGVLRIVVTDTGAGISEANQQRLFKEIVQFNPEVLQAGGGSGLGLWITNSIVQMHSGTIHAYSAGPSKGSTFTVEIGMLRLVQPNEAGEVLSHGMRTLGRDETPCSMTA